MSEVLVKDTPFCRCSVKPGTGYIIRLKEYKGALFAVDENGEISVSQSSKFSYEFNDWVALQKEIDEGYKYMAKVIMLGGYGKIEKPEYIKPSKLVDGGIYRISTGNYYLWVGKAQLMKNSRGFSSNRERSPYVVAEFGDYRPMVQGVQNGCLYVQAEHVWLDSRVTKLSKIVEEVYRPSSSFSCLYVNNEAVGSWRYPIN